MSTSEGLHRLPVWKHLLLLCCVMLESQAHKRKAQITFYKSYLSRCWLTSSWKMVTLIITTLSKLPRPFILLIFSAWNCCNVLGLGGWKQPCVSWLQGTAILWTECCVRGSTVKKRATDTGGMTFPLGRMVCFFFIIVGAKEKRSRTIWRKIKVQSREKKK